jgi:RNA polymerase sigma-70 factor (ECF subfamily)
VTEASACDADADVRTPATDPSDAFEAFYRAQYGPLSAYAYSLLRDADAAADVVSEALVRTWSRWAKVREPTPYSYLCVTNLCRERWRHEAVHRRVLPSLIDAQLVDPPEVDELLPLVAILPDRLRVPVLLHYYADLPVAEIAKVIRRPEGSVKQRLHQARRDLRRLYAKEMP